MIPWTVIDTAEMPGGGALRLLQHGRDFAIKLDRHELMNSRLHGSEEALATLACARIAERRHPRILIGGLGMGFTLRAALDALGASAQVVVAELVPAVVDWNRGPLAHLSGHSLDDARVAVRAADVGSVIRAEASAYDAILLDVDNGPDAFTAPSNAKLYGLKGLIACRRALAPAGALGVWSVEDDKRFTDRMRGAGFEVDKQRVPARPNSSVKHVIWIGLRR